MRAWQIGELSHRGWLCSSDCLSFELEQLWPPGLFKRGLSADPQCCGSVTNAARNVLAAGTSCKLLLDREEWGWRAKEIMWGELQVKKVPRLSGHWMLGTDEAQRGSPISRKGASQCLGLLGWLRWGLVPWGSGGSRFGVLLPSGRALQDPLEGKVCGAAHSSVSLSRHPVCPSAAGISPSGLRCSWLMQQMDSVQIASAVGWGSPRSLLRQTFRRAAGDPGSWLSVPLRAGAPQPPSPSLSAKLGIISECNLPRWIN